MPPKYDHQAIAADLVESWSGPDNYRTIAARHGCTDDTVADIARGMMREGTLTAPRPAHLDRQRNRATGGKRHLDDEWVAEVTERRRKQLEFDKAVRESDPELAAAIEREARELLRQREQWHPVKRRTA